MDNIFNRQELLQFLKSETRVVRVNTMNNALLYYIDGWNIKKESASWDASR